MLSCAHSVDAHPALEAAPITMKERAIAQCSTAQGVCAIGQQSYDGFGHQLESKFTCIASALVVGAEYVHVPFRGKAHGEDVKEFEDLMGFASTFRTVNRTGNQSKRLSIRQRAPSPSSAWPFKRPCRYCMNKGNLSETCRLTYHKSSWLRRVESEPSFRASACCADTVFVADNCYDVFNCHLDWPGLWHRALPLVHSLYFRTPKPSPAWTEGVTEGALLLAPLQEHARSSAATRWGAKVAIHLRLGDVNERALPVGYYARAVEALRRELSGSTFGGPPLFRIQTNGLPADVSMMRRKHRSALNTSDVIVDYSRYSPDIARRSSLGLAFHRMVTADVLVLSRSALSMAAALLSNGTVLFPRCWLEFRRPLPHWRLWDCCANASELVKGANCVSESRAWRLTRGERVRAG